MKVTVIEPANVDKLIEVLANERENFIYHIVAVIFTSQNWMWKVYHYDNKNELDNDFKWNENDRAYDSGIISTW